MIKFNTSGKNLLTLNPDDYLDFTAQTVKRQFWGQVVEMKKNYPDGRRRIIYKKENVCNS